MPGTSAPEAGSSGPAKPARKTAAKAARKTPTAPGAAAKPPKAAAPAAARKRAPAPKAPGKRAARPAAALVPPDATAPAAVVETPLQVLEPDPPKANVPPQPVPVLEDASEGAPPSGAGAAGAGGEHEPGTVTVAGENGHGMTSQARPPLAAPAPSPEAAMSGTLPAAARPQPARRGASIAESLLLLMVEPGWDDRNERFPAGLGATLAGAVLLDLALQGSLRLQQDRLKAQDPQDPAFAAAVALLRKNAGKDAALAFEAVARRASRLSDPLKDRLAQQGMLAVRRRRVLGILPRTELDIGDVAVERFRARVMRGLAGGGPLEAQEILLLGLVDAAGLLGQFVPSAAIAYNHKRIQGLMAGRDRLDYRTDQSLRSLQRDLLEFVLRMVRQTRIGG